MGGRLGEGDDGKEKDEGGESGVRRTMKKLDPMMPSAEERPEREMTPLPFRSWCRRCIRGRGKEEPCRRTSGDGEGLPEVHVDFMFMGEEKEGKTLAVLVGRERKNEGDGGDGGAEEVDGRVGVAEADGVAAGTGSRVQ